MKIRPMGAVISGAVLLLALGGCANDEPPATPAAPNTSAPAADPATSTASTTTSESTTDSGTTGSGTTESATTGSATSADHADPALPTESTAYADAFLAAWTHETQAPLEQFATPDALHSLSAWTPWDGAAWTLESHEEVDRAGLSATLVHYRTADNQLLTLTLDNAIVEAGGERAIIGGDYSLGDLPIPTDVEAYAQAFLAAVGTGDTEFALLLGPLDGFASVEKWSGRTFGMVEVTGTGGDEALVTVPFEEGGELQLTIDRESAEQGQAHAITSVVFFESGS